MGGLNARIIGAYPGIQNVGLRAHACAQTKIKRGSKHGLETCNLEKEYRDCIKSRRDKIGISPWCALN